MGRANNSGAIDGNGTIDIREDGVLMASTRAQGSIVSENGDINGGQQRMELNRNGGSRKEKEQGIAFYAVAAPDDRGLSKRVRKGG